LEIIMDEPVHTAPEPFATPLGPTPSGFGEPVKSVGKWDTPVEPVEATPDTKEQHFEAIRYLLDQLKVTADAPTKVTLDQICTRLDAIEDKPEKTVKW
jgi:hypothetical protein